MLRDQQEIPNIPLQVSQCPSKCKISLKSSPYWNFFNSSLLFDIWKCSVPPLLLLNLWNRLEHFFVFIFCVVLLLLPSCRLITSFWSDYHMLFFFHLLFDDSTLCCRSIGCGGRQRKAKYVNDNWIIYDSLSRSPKSIEKFTQKRKEFFQNFHPLPRAHVRVLEESRSSKTAEMAMTWELENERSELFFFSFICLRETTMMTSRKKIPTSFTFIECLFGACLACVVWLSRTRYLPRNSNFNSTCS